jgi:ubiquinone/menaquinone biosynthesis C-methylase UbiE
MVSELTRFETPLQTIELNDMDDFDRILDVGAGGEGLVARLKGEGVCGVDLRKEEIQEIRGRGVDCNWVVCDARRLCFKDEAFDLVSARGKQGTLV